jgi:hypothetical protein
MRVPTVFAGLCRRTTTQKEMKRSLFRNRNNKIECHVESTDSHLLRFRHQRTHTPPLCLASHFGHRVNATPPSVRCLVQTQHRPSFLRPEHSMTSRRPRKRQDALGKRIAISVLLSTRWTSMMPRSNFFRASRGGVLRDNIFVGSQCDETPLLQLFIVVFRYLAIYQHRFRLGGG